MRLTIHTDGGARGNPGPAAVGVVIEGTIKNGNSSISPFGGDRGRAFIFYWFSKQWN